MVEKFEVYSIAYYENLPSQNSFRTMQKAQNRDQTMRFVCSHQLGMSADSATECMVVTSDPPAPRPQTQPEAAIRWDWNT